MKTVSIFLTILMATMLFAACENTEVPVTDDDSIAATPKGTLRVIFKISHPWIPVNRIVRAELHVATTGTEILKGNYIQSANVTSFQQDYDFFLEPGTYYYEAVTACICEGDSCSAGGFPGNQWGTKSTMGKVTVEEDKITQVNPSFK